MRTKQDRIRHAIAFEIIGLAILIGVMAQLSYDMAHVGFMGGFFSIIATFWNYAFNLGFDRLMLKILNTLKKTFWLRILHSLSFEAGLLVITIPVIAWTLDISLWHAFIMDIGMVIFYVIYAYLFNLAYDNLFPIDEGQLF